MRHGPKPEERYRKPTVISSLVPLGYRMPLLYGVLQQGKRKRLWLQVQSNRSARPLWVLAQCNVMRCNTVPGVDILSAFCLYLWILQRLLQNPFGGISPPNAPFRFPCTTPCNTVQHIVHRNRAHDGVRMNDICTLEPCVVHQINGVKNICSIQLAKDEPTKHDTDCCLSTDSCKSLAWHLLMEIQKLLVWSRISWLERPIELTSSQVSGIYGICTESGAKKNLISCRWLISGLSFVFERSKASTKALCSISVTLIKAGFPRESVLTTSIHLLQCYSIFY